MNILFPSIWLESMARPMVGMSLALFFLIFFLSFLGRENPLEENGSLYFITFEN